MWTVFYSSRLPIGMFSPRQVVYAVGSQLETLGESILWFSRINQYTLHGTYMS